MLDVSKVDYFHQFLTAIFLVRSSMSFYIGLEKLKSYFVNKGIPYTLFHNINKKLKKIFSEENTMIFHVPKLTLYFKLIQFSVQTD